MKAEAIDERQSHPQTSTNQNEGEKNVSRIAFYPGGREVRLPQFSVVMAAYGSSFDLGSTARCGADVTGAKPGRRCNGAVASATAVRSDRKFGARALDSAQFRGAASRSTVAESSSGSDWICCARRCAFE